MAIKDVDDLSFLIKSDVPIIILQTHEENQAIELLTRVSVKNVRLLKTWSITKGLNRLGFGSDVNFNQDTCDPKKLLEHILTEHNSGIYILCDFHPYLENNPEIVRLLKEIALDYAKLRHTIVLLSHELTPPPELKRLCANFELSLPTEIELIAIIRETVRSAAIEQGEKFSKPSKDVLMAIKQNLTGLSREEAKRLTRNAIIDDGMLTECDIPRINKAKFELLDMKGVLSFEYDTEKFSDVGGLENLKSWVQQRKNSFSAAETKDRPKGVMLLGVQGGGKSLAAKAIAGMWQVPLLRLDMAALYNKYIGETEKNLRLALTQAELMSPCVMWIDEIEKGIQTSTDNDVGHRVLGTLLTWMAENQQQVFLVATSNDISKLPPELIRKGRLDEIFFVDLPRADVRKDILSIHLRKRDLDPAAFDTDALADSCDGFAGAEIEQAIVSGIYAAKANGTALNTQSILNEMDKTHPLSVVMAEQMTALRQWANGRTVSAN